MDHSPRPTSRAQYQRPSSTCFKSHLGKGSQKTIAIGIVTNQP
jgi:hypothetical protein